MKRLNTRTGQKARPPRLPPSRDGGLERQNSFDSEASLASSQSFASNITTGSVQLWPTALHESCSARQPHNMILHLFVMQALTSERMSGMLLYRVRVTPNQHAAARVRAQCRLSSRGGRGRGRAGAAVPCGAAGARTGGLWQGRPSSRHEALQAGRL